MTIKSAEQLMKDNLIVKHYAGSIAYGTNLPTSDIDFRGIFVADPINIRTPFFPLREATDTSEEDTKFYELAQYVKLAANCNPNIMETLWVDDSDIVHTTDAYKHLVKYREQLLSSKAAFTYSGYAMSQLLRIKGHNKWINNPQSIDPPRQIDFVSLVHNFTNQKLFKIDITTIRENHRLIPYEKNIFGVYPVTGYQLYSDKFTLNTLYENKDDFFTVNDNGTDHRRVPMFIVKFNKEIYDTALVKWQQYWEWKKNRNPVRSELEEKFGYDTKHGMHLIRLLRTGAEILTDHVVRVKRPDAQELLDIRNGAMTYEEIVKYAEHMDNHIRTQLYTTTTLRKKPDLKLAAKLVMEVQDLIWGANVTT